MQRKQEPEDVTVDVRHAAVAFCSEKYLRVDGIPFEGWAPLTGDYQAADGNWVRLHCNFAHHACAAARALGCSASKEAFTREVGARTAVDVEQAVITQGGASGVGRNRDAWTSHPQYACISANPLLSIKRIGDADPVLPKRPIRILDLTRIISGPLASKVLAAYGADVIHVMSSRLPTIPGLDIEHGFGKRTCDIDVTTPEGAEKLRRLIIDADVFLESYRPGALDGYGFGFEDVRRLRPDIVYLSLSAYGDEGPWGGRRGFDSIVQMTSGIATAAADTSGKPRPLPCQGLDHATGYLAAFAITSALIRRANEGGAWHLKVCLAQTAELLWKLGLHEHLQAQLSLHQIQESLQNIKSAIGTIQYVPIPGRIGSTLFSSPHPPRLDQAVTWT